MNLPMNAPVIEARRLCKSFGALTVARDIDFALYPGARHALIGPNGAGKTTFVNLLTGVVAPSSGRVLIEGSDVTALSQTQRVKRGLARTFQINTLFQGLTVLENLCLAIGERVGAARDMVRPMGRRRDVIEEAFALLDGFRMADDAPRTLRELPYGRQRLVEIAIALGLKPKVLLLDEPAAGVASAETGLLLDTIAALPTAIAVLIIEHDMELVFRFASNITVLVGGEVLVNGTPQEIAANARVREVYLGSEHRTV